MTTLFYLPLEQYKERYTSQLSAAKTGWLEKKRIQYGIEYVRICDHTWKEPVNEGIKNGVALDPVRRSRFCLNQVDLFLAMMKQGRVKNRDVIYLDDFWTPGIEAIFYTAHMMNIRLHFYATCWAQSVDEFDFTYPMRYWLRNIEKAYGTYFDGIFVANTELKDKLVMNGVGAWNTVHVVGHPFDSEEVMSRMPPKYQDFIKTKNWPTYQREDAVVRSSRWDAEKDPAFFLKVIVEVLKCDPNIKFYICTSAPKLRSNNPDLLELLAVVLDKLPNNVFLKEGLTKEEYYAILTKSKIQFNSALQDWISYTLLEASVAGCYPVYPYFRSFPETLQYNSSMMYQKDDVADAVDLVLKVFQDEVRDNWSHEAIKERSWIHTRYNWTWLRMLGIMNLCPDGLKQELGEIFPVYRVP